MNKGFDEQMLDELVLRKFAQKYIWWKTSEEAMQLPDRIIAQVMNMGDYRDVELLTEQIESDALKKILTHSEAGQFNARSWAYWHYRLNLAELEQLPPMPIRKFA